MLWDLIKVTMKGGAVVDDALDGRGRSPATASASWSRAPCAASGRRRSSKERYAAGYEISCRLETRDDAHVADLVAFARGLFVAGRRRRRRGRGHCDARARGRRPAAGLGRSRSRSTTTRARGSA